MPSLTPLGLCTSCPRHEASRAPINTVPVPPSNPSTECVLCMKSDSSSATLYARKIAPESVQNNSSDNLTTSQVIGISLGIALIFLIALICWYLMAQKAKKKAADEERERAWIPPLPVDASRRVIGGAGGGGTMGLGKDKEARTMKGMMERGDWHK